MSSTTPPQAMPNTLTIVFCIRCRWLLRASWFAQECFTTFSEELGQVNLSQGGAGEFSIWLNNHCLWERKADGGFPELNHLKQMIRDVIAPEKSLGHSDKKLN